LVTSIWASDSEGWRLLPPVGFPDEQTLHWLVEQTPELLPLAGSPWLVILGSEVPLGGGYADLLAVEPNGRMVVIEVKLARNAEARRAVVAQILAYAAFMKGTSPDVLESEVLRSSLRKQEASTIGNLVASQDKEGSYDEATFASGLEESLTQGRFRLVLVLDDAPPELVRLVGYLESIAPELVIDLITLSVFDVNGSRVLVPQRVDPERSDSVEATPRTQTKQGHLIPPEEFETGIAKSAADAQPLLRRLYQWARDLEAEGVIRLLAFRGTTQRTTLLPYLLNDDAGLITVWNEESFSSISFWRSVFERRAPQSISQIEAIIAPAKVGQGTTVKAVSEELLGALADAYRSAAS
jgi:hypothetical protein